MGKILFDNEFVWTKCPPAVKCRLKSVHDIVDASAMLHGLHWIFRGQSDARWPLKTKLERECEGIMQEDERSAIKQFSDFANDLLDFEGTDIDYLAVMQHYGVPTRLLDFTWSFFIAMFFAVGGDVSGAENCAVWAVNFDEVFESSKLVQNEMDRKARQLFSGDDSREARELEYYAGMKLSEELLENDLERGRFLKTNAEKMLSSLGDKTVLGLLPVELPRNNGRLIAQKGLFLLPLDFSEFDKNLQASMGISSENANLEEFEIGALTEALRGGSLKIIKFELNKDLKVEVCNFLFDVNITARTLFPDLAGIAQHISYGRCKLRRVNNGEVKL